MCLHVLGSLQCLTLPLVGGGPAPSERDISLLLSRVLLLAVWLLCCGDSVHVAAISMMMMLLRESPKNTAIIVRPLFFFFLVIIVMFRIGFCIVLKMQKGRP